jgi:hypothetical protein
MVTAWRFALNPGFTNSNALGLFGQTGQSATLDGQ